MKKLTRVMAAAVTMVMFAFPSPVVAGVLSHWKFDTQTSGITPDSAGSAPGALMGGASIVAGGISGMALSLANFIGTNYPGGFGVTAQVQYVRMGDVYEFPFQPGGAPAFTLTAWVKPVINGQVGHVVGSYESPGNDAGYVLTTNFGGSSGTISGYTGSTATQIDANSVSTALSNTYDIYDGNWHQLALSYTGGLTPQTTLWVNGRIAQFGGSNATGTGGLIGPPDFREFLVGGQYFIPRGFNVGTYDGLIDDVQLYDTALTQPQIQLLYDNPGQNLTTIPEPASAALLILGAMIAARHRRRGAGATVE
jgi:hypothetical protein